MKSDQQQSSIEHLPGLFYLIDREGRLLNCNQGLANILGFAHSEELKDLNLYELLSQKYSESFVEFFRRQNQEITDKQQNKVVKENWQNMEIFLSYKTPLGNQLQNLSVPLNNYNEYGLNLSPEFNQQTNISALYPTPNNSPDYLFNIIALMPGNVYWKDKKGRFLGCNNNFAKIIKLDDPKKIIGLRDIDILTPEMANKVLAVDQWIIKNNHATVAIEEGFDLNSKKTTYLSHKVPLQDKNGNTIGIVGISLDINEHRQTLEEQLKQSNNSTEPYLYNNVEYLFNIITLMPGNVYWKDLEGRYLGCNNHFAKIIKLNNPKDIIGIRDIDLFFPAMADEVLKIDEAIIKDNKPLLIEEIGFDNEGNNIVYLSHKVPLQNKLGDPIGLLGISLDITERKRMEQELIAAKETISKLSSAKSAFLKELSSNITESIESLPDIIKQIKVMVVKKDNQEELDEAIDSLNNLLALLNKIQALPDNAEDEAVALEIIMRDVSLFFHGIIEIMGLVARLRQVMFSQKGNF